MLSDKPSWKKEEDYAYLLEETRLEAWAWEFLRRDPQYYADYRMFCDKSEDEKAQKFYKPSRNENEPEDVWRHRCEIDYGVTGKTLSLAQKIGSKWLLEEIYSPDISYDAGVSFLNPDDLAPHIIKTHEECESYFRIVEIYEEHDEYEQNQIAGQYEAIDENYIIVAFDLTRASEPQIKRVKKIFNKRKKARSNNIYPEPKRWVKYLRTLDAISEANKPSNIELAKTLSGYNYEENYDFSQSGHELVGSALEQQELYRNLIYGFHKYKLQKKP